MAAKKKKTKNNRNTARSKNDVEGASTVAAGTESTGGEGRAQGGFEKSSTAQAAPARQRSKGVRVQTEAERRAQAGAARGSAKAQSAAERKRYDKRMRKMAARAILNKDEAYQAKRRKWWIFIAVSEAIIVFALVAVMTVPSTSSSYLLFSYASTVLIVVAYVIIIIAVFYDWKTMRPTRERAKNRANSMSRKKAVRLLEQAAQEEIDKQERDAREVASKKHSYRGSK